MPLKSNEDGSYVASWVPSTSGKYLVQVFIDGKSAGTSGIFHMMYIYPGNFNFLQVKRKPLRW